ncbi:MAG: hypothetical protein ACRDJP_09595, partial [Actinomycetota bacterium]
MPARPVRPLSDRPLTPSPETPVTIPEPSEITRRMFHRGAVGSAGAVAATRVVVSQSPAEAKRRRKRRARTFTVQDGHLVAENKRVRVVFDGTSGGIRSVQNRITGQDLLAPPQGAPTPWRMTPQDGTATQSEETFAPQDFTFEIAPDGRSATLRWGTGHEDLTAEVRAVLPPKGDLELWPRIVNERHTRPPQTFT